MLGQFRDLDTLIDQGRRLSAVGRMGALISAALVGLQLAVGLAQRLGLNLQDQLHLWPLALGLVVFTVSVVFLGWTRIWAREARQAYRYSYSLDAFEPISKGDRIRLGSICDWLHEDLTLKLTERIGRISLLDDRYVREASGVRLQAHLHIACHYGVREESTDAGKCAVIDLRPQVRIGPVGNAATVALPARLQVTGAGGTNGKPGAMHLEPLQREQLLESLYFSVATKVYKQIRADVQTKIAQLPTPYLRGIAYVYEAEDYARSNTLDAYDEAAELFGAALRELDPCRRPVPRSGALRRPQVWLRRLEPKLHKLRRRSTHVTHRLGRREVMIARAEVGSAATRLNRINLAVLSGRRASGAFEAHASAQSAVQRLGDLPPDLRDWSDVMFAGRVTLAYASTRLGCSEGAADMLEQARRSDPTRAESSAIWHYVAALNEPHFLTRVRLLTRATELDPHYELALFEIAFSNEMRWRSRPELEAVVARQVEAEYEAVSRLNPGNIGAWANLGYVRWLMADAGAMAADGHSLRPALAKAVAAFKGGIEYKQVKRETLVAELDYGVARAMAESGEVAEAYAAYARATATTLGLPARTYPDYYFELIGDAILDRFRRYRDRVEQFGPPGEPAADPKLARLWRSVRAFVLNDYGEASFMYYRRSFDESVADEAMAAFDQALELNPTNIIARYNRAALQRWRSALGESTSAQSRSEEAERDLDEVLRQEPSWPPAQLLIADIKAQLATGRFDDAANTRRREAVAMLNSLLRREGLTTDNHLPSTSQSPRPTRTPIDLDGQAVANVVAAQTTRWEHDVSELEVDALISWCGLLASRFDLRNAQEAADRLARHLQTRFHPCNWDLMACRRSIAEALLTDMDGDPAERDRLRFTMLECQRHLRAKVVWWLRMDPANRHWLGLLAAFDLFSDATLPRAATLRNALGAAQVPAATLYWLGRQLEDLDDSAACQAYADAIKAPRPNCRNQARIALARLMSRDAALSKAEKEADAASLLREVINDDQASRGEAATLLAGLLLERGEAAAAERLYRDLPAERVGLARALVSQAKYSKARKLLKQARKQDVRGATAAMAELRQRRGDADGLFAMCHEPDDWLELATWLEAQGRAQEAEAALREILRPFMAPTVRNGSRRRLSVDRSVRRPGTKEPGQLSRQGSSVSGACGGVSATERDTHAPPADRQANEALERLLRLMVARRGRRSAAGAGVRVVRSNPELAITATRALAKNDAVAEAEIVLWAALSAAAPSRVPRLLVQLASLLERRNDRPLAAALLGWVLEDGSDDGVRDSAALALGALLEVSDARAALDVYRRLLSAPPSGFVSVAAVALRSARLLERAGDVAAAIDLYWQAASEDGFWRSAAWSDLERLHVPVT